MISWCDCFVRRTHCPLIRLLQAGLGRDEVSAPHQAPSASWCVIWLFPLLLVAVHLEEAKYVFRSDELKQFCRRKTEKLGSGYLRVRRLLYNSSRGRPESVTCCEWEDFLKLLPARWAHFLCILGWLGWLIEGSGIREVPKPGTGISHHIIAHLVRHR